MSEMVTTEAINLSAVNKAYTGQRVLDRLNFSVGQGKIVGLLGRNGSGKSTMIECMLGLQQIDSGSRALLGDNPDNLSEDTRAKLGYVPQLVDSFGGMSGQQMLSFFKAFHHRWNDEKVRALLDRWSINDQRPINKLSPGERQRLAIIRALAHEPELLIFDEPVASLDPAGRRDFLSELVDNVIAHNTTVLFSTHILTDLERVASEVAILHGGKILLQQPADDLKESVVQITVAATQMEGLQKLLQTACCVVSRQSADTLITSAPREIQMRCQQEYSGLSIAPVSLEDFFIEVSK
jgi:ABC-2 type transport system ATP-binding protein